jgi:uncharacterized MAPEG superfamily protein
MTLAFWCLLLIVPLPYFLSVAARSAAGRADYVADPRAYSETLSGWRRRARLAHLNAFEATPAVLAGLAVAVFAQAPPAWIDGLALGFVGCRLLHAACCLADRPMLRSHAWRGGMLCVIGLFVVAATHGR